MAEYALRGEPRPVGGRLTPAVPEQRVARRTPERAPCGYSRTPLGSSTPV